VRFNNHYSVVDNLFTRKAHSLQPSGDVKFHVGTSVDTSHFLDKATKHAIAALGESIKGNLVIYRFVIKE
jgi:hypothetical protein